MFKRILVAVDGSTTSARGLKKAIELAKNQEGAALRIVHVTDITPALGGDSELGDIPEILDAIRRSGEQVLEQAVATAREAGIAAESKQLELDQFRLRVADMIAAEADAWQADVIVIGSHGRRGVRRLLLGSVAEGVARTASKPVLLVHGE
jgi:nucleotide-binding universal stress UspA family protein